MVAKPGEIDFIIVHGLAFDTKGGRLGQGKSYYNRVLSKMRKDHAVPRLVDVGVEPQLVDLVPTTELDFTMDFVVLPSKLIEIKS